MGAAEGHLLARALGRILPGRDETLLLRAILHRGEPAREAWDAFRGPVRDLPALFRTDTGNRKRLSPLLLASIRENRLEADPGLATVVKTATLREELRVDAYRRIAGEVYAALHDEGVPFVVLKGAALMETVYAEAAYRHAHDIDLLLPEGALDRAAARLRALGLVDAPALPWGQGLDLRHATELPVLLTRRLFRIPFYRGGHATVAERGADWRLGEGPLLRRPDATDALLLALGHASYCPGRSNLLWAVDAWMLLRGIEAVDWDALPERAREMRVELPVAMMLDYLGSELDAPVPEGVAGALRAGVEGAGGIRRDVALFGARQAQGAHPELEGRPRTPWRERLTLLRWELLPSREYVSWAYGRPPAVLLPLIYLARPFSALAERARWAVVRRLRRRPASGEGLGRRRSAKVTRPSEGSPGGG